MTERCQTKFTEKFENQNYVIYVGILVASVAVLYFYRFHFATIAFSYVLGCLACYYGLNSSILDSLVNKLKCHLVIAGADEENEEENDTGCATCGSSNCPRHDPVVSTEPWVGLQIHKQLDQAIEDFYNAILEQFITSWYSKITLQPFFVDELRHQLRYASACLLRRAVKINYSRFITERLIPCALRHYTLCADLPDAAPLLASKLAVHPAAANRNAELKYLRSVTNAIMPYLLKNGELQNSVFRVLVREIFAGWVLLSLTDVLADPYILNALVILATGDETMAQLPATPDYKVEFLSTFVRHTDSVYSSRCRLLRVDLELVVGQQDQLYAFMQHVKTTGRLHLLQFYKDIKLFQTKILNPELSESEQSQLYKEGCEILARYGALHGAGADEFKKMLENGADIKRLQTSPALYQAARESHAALEKIMLPRFLHSEEFYKLLIGSRIPTGYQKQHKKPQQTRITAAALKSALRSSTLDGQILDVFTNAEETDDSVENINILKYLDSIAAEDVQEQDLSTYKVVLTDVETRLQAPPRRGTVRVFELTVQRIDGTRGERPWGVERSEHDFHLLRAKLIEFHGERLFSDLPLPSRRDNSPNETLRYKYEDFLQRVLQKSLLQTSELLHLFLTVDGDFSHVVQASTLNANSSDLGNIYQSVTHKLRKEKGQHLESFLKNFLVSSDMERYQAL
ncbi:sorting nexin-14-like [Choristoneura fumiferana]